MSEKTGEQLAKEHGIELVESSEIIQKQRYQEYKYKNMKFHERIKTVRFWKYIIYVFLWLVSLKLIEKWTGFGSLFVIITLFVLVFTNLSNKERKEGELSAYSIFNEGAKRILGDNPEQFMAQFGINRRRLDEDDDNDNADKINKKKSSTNLYIPKDRKEWMKWVTKNGNKLCYCGSDKKYKKCCYYRELKVQQQIEDGKKKLTDQQYQELMLQSDEDD